MSDKNDDQYQGQSSDEHDPSADEQTPQDATPSDEEASGEEKEWEAETPAPEVELNQPQVNFTEAYSTTRKTNTGETLDDPVSLVRESFRNVSEVLDTHDAFLTEVRKQEEDLIRKLTERNKRLKADMGNPWYRNLMASLETAQMNEMGLRATEREESDWRQVLEHEGAQLRGGRPKQRLTGGQSKEETMAYLARRAGVGAPFDTPLYRSGLWLRFKTPSLAEITEFRHHLDQLKVTLGRQTKGLALSHTNQTLRSAAVDFCLQYVIDANIHYQTPSDLKPHIALSDVEVLMWGLSSAMYPKGFAYSHSCVADVQKCQHIVEEMLNVHYLQWTDYNALTKKQLKHMAGRFTKVSEEDLETYRNEHQLGNDRIVWYDNGLGLKLRIPSLQDYEDAGRDWIEGIIAQTQGAFNEPPHGANRNRYIQDLGMATAARQYSHWVAAVYEVDEDGNESMVTDQADVVNSTLELIFSEEEYINTFLDSVGEFIDDGMVTIVAIPSFNCPSCNTPQAKKFHERFPHLVPLDMLSTFFILVDRKLR